MDDAEQLALARETLLHLYALSDGPTSLLGAICLHGLEREDEISVGARERMLLPPVSKHEIDGGGGWPVTFDLRLGDCFSADGMASLPDRSVDVVITDPPYSEHVHSKSRRGLTVTHVGGRQDEISERRELGFESITQAEIESAADHFARLARRWTLVFCDVESSHLWAGALRSAGLDYVRTMAWVKLGGAPQFTGDRPAVAFEAIVLAHPTGRKRWNGGGKGGVYSVPTAIDRDRRGWDARAHTTQKPLLLMENLVVDFTDAGETVLDPFAGSGTTGVAALRLGRNFIGVERDSKYHEAARERLSNVRALPVGYHGTVAQGSLL